MRQWERLISRVDAIERTHSLSLPLIFLVYPRKTDNDKPTPGHDKSVICSFRCVYYSIYIEFWARVTVRIRRFWFFSVSQCCFFLLLLLLFHSKYTVCVFVILVIGLIADLVVCFIFGFFLVCLSCSVSVNSDKSCSNDFKFIILLCRWIWTTLQLIYVQRSEIDNISAWNHRRTTFHAPSFN